MRIEQGDKYGTGVRYCRNHPFETRLMSLAAMYSNPERYCINVETEIKSQVEVKPIAIEIE
jgi:hypothetical protein